MPLYNDHRIPRRPKTMTESAVLPENSTFRLRRLMLARVVIVTFLLGIASFIEAKGMESQAAISVTTLIRTIVLTYILSIVYLFLLKYIGSIQTNIYIQSVIDVLLVTAMVYATGGIRSIYSVFYPLVIIYAALFSGRRGGLIVASAASIFYGLFADLEFYGVIYPLYGIPIPDYPLNSGYVFTRIATHIFSFYLIAVLTSFVVEQEKKARSLLAEKQSAFDQLDLLHRSIIESVETGIMTVNLAGQIKSFNRAAVEITGFKFREIENRKVDEVFGGISPPVQKQAGDADTAVKTRFESAFLAKDGKNLTLGGSISPLRAPDGATIGRIVIFQDLTTVNEMRESLEKSRRLAFVGEIAAGLAHEIRNPLASISGSIQMLKRQLGLSETNEKLMQIILRGKDQLESFLKDFLLLARPAPGVRENVDVIGTIRDILESVRYVPDWHEMLKVVVSMPPEPPLAIHANKNEIRQIIWNIVLNAIQAMPEEGELTVEARSLAVGGVDGVEVRIADTGCGIEERELKKIFEPFYTTRERGTGLGLAVVNRIVGGYGGRVNIESRPGRARGTRCTLWLPCRTKQGEET